MTRKERRLLLNTIGLGMLLTLIVIVADRWGALAPLERYLYDYRCRDCQFFSPPPTDRIVHLDIDDPSLHEIGAFPWPREYLARMVDEIHLAGAKVLGMDIIFSESQEARYRPAEDGTLVKILDDADFATSIQRANNILLPLSVNVQKTQHTPLYHEIVRILTENLELDSNEMIARLKGTQFDSQDLPQRAKEEFLSAREEAMFERVDQSIGAGISTFSDLRAKLTPVADKRDLTTDATVLLGQTIPKVQSVRNILKFTRPVPPDIPLVVAEDEQAVTIPELSGAVRYCGYVDFLPSPDGVVRTIPLFVNYRGRLIPHMAMATTCALLGVDLNQIEFTADRVILPLPSGEKITIPIHMVNSANYGAVNMFMDIPWFGTSEWKYAFDANHADSKQHIPLNTVWRICQLRRQIETNDNKADVALNSVVQTFGNSFEKASKLLAKPEAQRDSDARAAAIEDTVSQLEGLADIPALQKAKPGELNKDDAEFLGTYTALKQVGRAQQILNAQVKQQRAVLRGNINNCAVIIGWTVTGNTDTYSTSIHAQCPGVVIQSEVINGILTRHLWWSAPWWQTGLITLFIGLLISFAVARLQPKEAMVCTLGVMIAYFVINGIVLFDWGNRIYGAAAPLATAMLVWSSLTLVRYISERTQRSRIESRFRSYVDPQLVNYVIEHIDSARLDGQVKLMTVVFTDLAGFTSISEKLRERTVPLLNEYMSLMLPVIREHHGYWNKFLGDGIMFFFNAPDENPNHARDAVSTVLDMQKALIGFNKHLLDKGLPQVAMRAGISTGPMVVGDAGSTDVVHGASDYTVLGDEVNLGARLESANKALGSRTLLNAQAAGMCGEEFLLRPMGNICVVGKSEGVMTYEAICRVGDATDQQKRLAHLSRQVVDHFRAGDFERCIGFAKEMEEAFGSAKFSQLYLNLARLYVAEPPGDKFDGQIVLSEK